MEYCYNVNMVSKDIPPMWHHIRSIVSPRPLFVGNIIREGQYSFKVIGKIFELHNHTLLLEPTEKIVDIFPRANACESIR